MPSSFITVLHHRISLKFFVNGMKNIGMHLSDGRSLHGFSSSNCSNTSLHPLCAGSKPKTYSLSNTISSVSSRLAHLQRSLAWQSARFKAKYETKDDSAGRVRRIFCASKDQKDIYYRFEGESEATPHPPKPQILHPLRWQLRQL